MSCVRSLWKKRNNLSFRLAATYALLFAATLLVLSLMIYLFSRGFLINRQKQELAGSTQNIVEVFYEELAEGLDPLAPQLLWELNTSQDRSLLLLSPDRQPLNQAASFSVLVSQIPACNQEAVLYRQTDGLPLLAWERDILMDGQLLGTLVILTRLDNEFAFLHMLLYLLAGLNVAGGLAALTVGWYTSKQMLKPISAIIRRAAAIGKDTLHTRLEVPEAEDELRLLAVTLNAMLERVEAAFVRQGQFTQDVSHELRTPLAVLQGNADLLARWGKDAPAVRDRCVGAIQKQTAYMHRLVENLLFLSREGSGAPVLQKEQLSLPLVLNELVLQRQAFDPAHVYDFRADPITLWADESLLYQLMLILLDNAARYTPPGKAIRLSAGLRDAQAEIQVQDEGCGVPPEQLTSIFDRFYRVDKARSRETGGTGLGLAIARRIVTLHGGSIDAQNAAEGGLIVRILLPIHAKED